MIIAEMSIAPFGVGTSLSPIVKEAVRVIKESGLKFEVGGMSTTVEVPDLDTLFELIKKAEAAEIDAGAERILISLKVDHRIDKDITINSKRTAVLGEH